MPAPPRKFWVTATCTEGCTVEPFSKTKPPDHVTEGSTHPVPHTGGECKGKGKVTYTATEVSAN